MAAPIFVFGSNLAGRHGKGAALWARQHRGAEYGVGMMSLREFREKVAAGETFDLFAVGGCDCFYPTEEAA